MVTGVGVCRDALDADGNLLPASDADPLTVRFKGQMLDLEKPDLVVLTGDQMHHGIPDSQTALFKVFAPMIEREIPWAAVFGNHDTEGEFALTSDEQMSILEDLPFSLRWAGPEHVDGVGNYHLPVFARNKKPQLPLLDLFFLDSHGEVRSGVKDPNYEAIKESQIEWFRDQCRALRENREDSDQTGFHATLVFQHILLPEFRDEDLLIKSGQRGEPTEGPSINTHFYDALVKEGVAAIGCGHDHVNDFCALPPGKNNGELRERPHATHQHGPWLCHGECSGFGAYCSYGGQQYYRRTRVWEIDSTTESLWTWKRVECATERVDQLLLMEKGVVGYPAKTEAD